VKFDTISRTNTKNDYGGRFVVIPQSISNPESTIKVRVITVKDQLEPTVKTLHKAGTLQIEISEEIKTLVDTNLEKELHAICNPLIPIEDTTIYLYMQTGKYNHFEDTINPSYFTSFRESDISANSVAFKWN